MKITKTRVLRLSADNSKMLLSTCWFSIGVSILLVKDRNVVMTYLFILCVEILLQEHDITQHKALQ